MTAIAALKTAALALSNPAFFSRIFGPSVGPDLYIVVTDHPNHAVSDVYGEYGINDVPPGAYQLKVWREMLATQEKPVEVKPGAATVTDFSLNGNSAVKMNRSYL